MAQKSTKTDPVEVVADVLRAFGEDTAANVANKAGVAYSTVTPKLRKLEATGRAERVNRDGRAYWRLVTPTAPTPDTAKPGDGTDTADRDSTTGEDTAATGEAPEPVNERPEPTQPEPTQPEPTDSDDARIDEGGVPEPVGDHAQPGGGPDATSTAAAAVEAPDPAPSPESGTPAAEPRNATSSDGPEPRPAAAEGEKIRRPAGALDRTALRVLQQDPDAVFKVTELARRIDQMDAADGHNYPTASPGAVVLAGDRLVDRGDAAKVSEKPVAYQLAAAVADQP